MSHFEAENMIRKSESYDQYYDVLNELGRGRFAVVRKCVCKKTGKAYAAKIIKKSRTNSHGRSGREQLLLEIDILSKSTHPKMVRLLDVFETRSEMQIILELAEGGDLHRHCIEGDVTRTEKEICYLIRQIVEAVRYLHDQTIVHLDLKPDNILLAKACEIFPEIRLIDFGLSRRLDGPISQFDIVGTPEYVAPEVLSFEPIDFGSDMWSVGVVTYVLLSGISPFAGDDVMETYSNIGMVEYDFDCEEFDDISDEAIDFMERLLVRQPKERLTARAALDHPWLQQLEGGISAGDVLQAQHAQSQQPEDVEINPLIEEDYLSSSESEAPIEKSGEFLNGAYSREVSEENNNDLHDNKGDVFVSSDVSTTDVPETVKPVCNDEVNKSVEHEQKENVKTQSNIKESSFEEEKTANESSSSEKDESTNEPCENESVELNLKNDSVELNATKSVHPNIEDEKPEKPLEEEKIPVVAEKKSENKIKSSSLEKVKKPVPTPETKRPSTEVPKPIPETKKPSTEFTKSTPETKRPSPEVPKKPLSKNVESSSSPGVATKPPKKVELAPQSEHKPPEVCKKPAPAPVKKESPKAPQKTVPAPKKEEKPVEKKQILTIEKETQPELKQKDVIVNDEASEVVIHNKESKSTSETVTKTKADEGKEKVIKKSIASPPSKSPPNEPNHTDKSLTVNKVTTRTKSSGTSTPDKSPTALKKTTSGTLGAKTSVIEQRRLAFELSQKGDAIKGVKPLQNRFDRQGSSKSASSNNSPSLSRSGSSKSSVNTSPVLNRKVDVKPTDTKSTPVKVDVKPNNTKSTPVKVDVKPNNTKNIAVKTTISIAMNITPTASVKSPFVAENKEGGASMSPSLNKRNSVKESPSHKIEGNQKEKSVENESHSNHSDEESEHVGSNSPSNGRHMHSRTTTPSNIPAGSLRRKIPGGIAAKMADKFLHIKDQDATDAAAKTNHSPKGSPKVERVKKDIHSPKGSPKIDRVKKEPERKSSPKTTRSSTAPAVSKSTPTAGIKLSMNIGGSLSASGKKLNVGPLVSSAGKKKDEESRKEKENNEEEGTPIKVRTNSSRIKLGIGKPKRKQSEDKGSGENDDNEDVKRAPPLRELRGKSTSVSRRRADSSPNSPRKNYRRLYITKVRNSKLYDPDFNIMNTEAAKIMQRVDNDVLQVELKLASTDLKLLP